MRKKMITKHRRASPQSHHMVHVMVIIHHKHERKSNKRTNLINWSINILLTSKLKEKVACICHQHYAAAKS